MSNDKPNQGKLAALIARAQKDANFREALVADPKAVLAAEGIALPDDLNLRVVELASNERLLVLPPPGEALSDEALAGVVGGLNVYWRTGPNLSQPDYVTSNW